jgi:hypothetical protein
VVADEALATEILNTRSLAKLKLARLAPTVLTSPAEPRRVLDLLRAAGMSPVAEDPSGAIVVEHRDEHRAETDAITDVRPRTRLGATELAKRLTTGPNGDHGTPTSHTVDLLTELNPSLDEAELVLLSHAVDNHDDVVIAYHDKNNSHSIREIRPVRIQGRWLVAFCHLRGADREFTIANIESVAPAH